MRKKSICISTVLVVISLILTACAPPGSPSPKSGSSLPSSSQAAVEKKIEGEITLWNMNAGGARDGTYEQIAKKFMEKYPGTSVKVSHFPNVESQTKMELAASSNAMPSVSDQNIKTLSTLRSLGAVLPLDDYLSDSESISSILPNLIKVYRSYSPDGKLYALPRNAQLNILWYRSDKFGAPKTWDEFFSTIEKATNKSNKEYGYVIRGMDGTYPAMSIAYGYSGIKDFYTADGKCTINDPKHVEILEKYYRMYKVYTAESDISAAFKEMTVAFGSGSAQMFLHNTGSYVDHVKNLGAGKFAATVLPPSPNGTKIEVDQGSPGFCMGATNNKNYYTAFKLIDFLESAGMQSLYSKAVGTVPTNVKVFEEDWAKQIPQYQMVLDKLSGKDGTAIVPAPVYLPDYSKISSDIGDKGFQKVMTGEKKVKDVLDELAVAFEKALKEYKANAK